MSDVTGLNGKTREQYAEMGISRVNRDMTDQSNILQCFRLQNPFLQSTSGLHCLSSGVTAVERDGVNCDDVETVGATIQKQLDGCLFFRR
jgi:hypothetical protein